MENKADSELVARLGRAGEFLSENWLRLCALVVTGVLTGLAGWRLTNNWFFTASLILLAEGASLFWTARASDNGNGTQQVLSVIGSVVAWTAIVVTDLASATILAADADVEIFSAFQQVPEWAQSVVTYVLPTLAVIHGVFGTAHHYFSEGAKLARDVAKTRRDAVRKIKQAEADAQVSIAKAQADRYAELAEANAARIGQERGNSLWNTAYRNDNSNANVTTIKEDVVTGVPFQENGSNKRKR